MDIDARLKELGISIPEPGKPLASYVPGIIAGDFIFISGQLPVQEGQVLYCGKLGRDLSITDGQAACRQAVINCLAVLKNCLGDWDRLEQIVKITGYIQSEDDFYQHPSVLNGASDLLEQILGERGKHSRVAIGVSSLPLNACCEIEMVARVR